VRLFVGIPLPAEQREQLDGALAPPRRAHPRVKWVEPALYHLTLQFLGEWERQGAAALAEALDALAARAPFALRLGAPLRLPPGRRGRVFALSLADGSEPLQALAAAVAAATARLGAPVERRPFKAHLTLARARRDASLPADLSPESWTPPVLAPWRVDGFHLFESLLRPEGPEYRSRHRVDLRG